MTKAAGRKKIMLVAPPRQSGLPEVVGRWMPLNLVYLAGAAREAGVVAEIYDAMTLDHGYQQIERQLREAGADYLATGAVTATINDALKLLETAKRVNPETVTVLGGVHASFMYREILAAKSAVDYIVIGEGESTLRQLLHVLERAGDPAAVPGLAYRRGESLVVTPVADPVADLDALPAAWDLLDWGQYSYFLVPESRFATVSTSRGCRPGRIFCAQHEFWGKRWRARDPRKVADEMAHLYGTYQVNVFLIADEDPTRDPGRFEALLDELIARELPVHLIMESRASDIVRDKEIFWKYCKAGVIHVSLGAEAADRQSLEQIGVEPTAGPVKQALDIMQAHGVVGEASFLVGFPDETAASVKATLKLAQHYNPDSANFFAVTPWPYAGIDAEIKPLTGERDYARYNLVDPVVEPRQMSLRQVEAALAECYRKFYMGKIVELLTMKDCFRRRYLVRATKLIMSSAFVMRKLALGTSGSAAAKDEGAAPNR